MDECGCCVGVSENLSVWCVCCGVFPAFGFTPRQVDKWYIILNGEVRWIRASGTAIQAVHHVGDSFGISGNQRAYHQTGQMVAAKDCQVRHA